MVQSKICHAVKPCFCQNGKKLMQHSSGNITDVLTGHAQARPSHRAFVWLENGETVTAQWTFDQLLANVKKLAALLSAYQLAGKRALLVYSNAMDFTTAFLACQYAGVVAVPVFFAANKRYQAKLIGIMEDAQVGAVLTLAAHKKSMDTTLGTFWQQNAVTVVCTDDYAAAELKAIPNNSASPSDIAFIQYTSGSTGKPKGVVVTHQNLLHNQQLIQQTFGCNPQSVILSWLPFHHDMGLIGNILHSIYVGCTCVVMAPMDFIQQPLNWLRAIGRYRATHSGGPNFAFDYCVNKIAPQAIAELDLSSWKVAFNGAEPVKAASLQKFADQFAPAGFDASAFHPCYGLAEATLLVSGRKPTGQTPQIQYIQQDVALGSPVQIINTPTDDSKAVVSSGSLPEGMQLQIMAPNGTTCNELEAGEICIHGDSVTQSYWNKDNTEYFYQLADGPYLRTGDSGFMYQGELFVSGRLKEMLIIRGANFYPYDIEHQVANAVEAIELNGVAAFGVEAPEEQLVLVAELKRTYLQMADTSAIIAAIEAELAGIFGITAYDIVLTTPMGIPRTTSGKLQRLQCRTLYLQQGFSELGSKRGMIAEGSSSADDLETVLQRVKETPTVENIKAYLIELVSIQTRYQISDEHQDLMSFGIDSIQGIEIIQHINRDLDIFMPVTTLFENPTIASLAMAIEQLLWLKNIDTNEEEGITI
jgi:acyl-CoA synthetase (AMP-forming)/AMP-acid ligase II/acyl carrier protein